jgi:hypothetical protein
MPELTRLSVYNFYFRAGDDGCVDPFSAFKKLNTLIINNCTVVNAQTLCISSTMLVNLTIFGYYRHDSYNLSTPSLLDFSFIGIPNQKLCGSHLSSVKRLYIDFDHIKFNDTVEEDSSVLFWLLDFTNITSLKVSNSTLQVLTLFLKFLLELLPFFLFYFKLCPKYMTLDSNSPSSFVAYRFSP